MRGGVTCTFGLNAGSPHRRLCRRILASDNISTRLPAHDNNPLQASSAENPLHSAPVAVSEYAIALPTLDGDPACALGSISSFGSKALWFEITDGLRQYRPMPSFFPPERSGDMRA